MSIPGISKSRFTDYLECPKLGYMSCYRDRFKHLADPLDWMSLHLIGEGNRAGQMARECFPGGRLIGYIWDLAKARADTAAAMRDEAVTYVFEGAFATEGLLCRVDLLRKVEDGVVDIVEVKATNSVKPEHLADVGFQSAVLQDAGLQIRTVSLMHFDPDYVHPGGDCYDVEALFAIEDVTEEARAWVREKRDGLLDAMRSDLALPEPPRISVRSGCRGCVYYRQACAPEAPEHPVFELGSARSDLLTALCAAGIEDLRDVPDDFPGLADGHRLVLEAVQSGGLALDREGFNALAGDLVYPLWFLDFETYMPGLPIFAGMRPWQQIPFQWSLHLENADGTVSHDEFLKVDGSDPRRPFAESLIAAVGGTGSIVVYNKGMESTRLRELARDLPDLATPLLALDARVVDLLPIVRRTCYHLDFHGSRSLKAVAPVVAPHLSYEELSVKAGMEAMEAYAAITDPATSDKERDRLRVDLLKYCSLDTQAMMEVLGQLRLDSRPVMRDPT
jgi:hypothetical protein